MLLRCTFCITLPMLLQLRSFLVVIEGSSLRRSNAAAYLSSGALPADAGFGRCSRQSAAITTEFVMNIILSAILSGFAKGEISGLRFVAQR
jgi:hypothetical protein